MIDATITLEELKRAVVELEIAHGKGYTASVAVLTLVKGGRNIDDCVLELDGLLAVQPGPDGVDLGRQSQAKWLAPLYDRDVPERCPKCNAVSGNDWKRCNGKCPMPMSPYYDAKLAARVLTAARETRETRQAVEERLPEPLHILSQEGQPYGSERRCCNRCGIMIWGSNPPAYTESWEAWNAAPNNCSKVKR